MSDISEEMMTESDVKMTVIKNKRVMEKSVDFIRFFRLLRQI